MVVTGASGATRHIQATHAHTSSRTLQSPPVRPISPDQRSILREIQSLSPAEFNAGGPVTTVTRHINCTRRPVNRTAPERPVIGTALDQGVDTGISPAEVALGLRSARSPRAHCRRDLKKEPDATDHVAAPAPCRSRHNPPTSPACSLGKVSKIERFRCSTRQQRQNERHATGR